MKRRDFLKRVAIPVIGSACFPSIIPASALGRDGTTSPNNRIVMGCIGVGEMGSGHLQSLLEYPDVRVAAICDVRESFRRPAKDRVDAKYGDRSCDTTNDFRELLSRKDLDAVLIAVPDHWHALIGIEAARNGKDMYYEKPLSVSVTEDKAVREAVNRSGVIFQFGTQQRSSQGYRFACELVRNGKIGQLQTIMIGSATSPDCPNLALEPVPSGFDYNFWLGPAPWAPYNHMRCTRNWTHIYDYSLGCVSGAWGIHDVDIAQWALDADHTGPVAVEGWGTFPRDGLYDTATAWEVEHTYANGVKLIHMDMPTALRRAWQFKMHWMSMLFVGNEGWVFVNRAGIDAHPPSLLKLRIGPNEVQLPESRDHRRNFLKAVKTRQQPISPIEAAVRSDTVCHQADISMRLKRKLRWDPVQEIFPDDLQANRMLSRPMRSPWHL
jgi:predicted dehydrogenase